MKFSINFMIQHKNYLNSVTYLIIIWRKNVTEHLDQLAKDYFISSFKFES